MNPTRFNAKHCRVRQDQPLPMSQLAEKYGVPKNSIKTRVRRGQFPDAHITIPHRYQARKLWYLTAEVKAAMKDMKANSRNNKDRNK